MHRWPDWQLKACEDATRPFHGKKESYNRAKHLVFRIRQRLDCMRHHCPLSSCKLNAYVSPQHTSQLQTLKRNARSAIIVEHAQSLTSAGLTSCPCEDLRGPAGQGHASHVESAT